jgi:hypothetical protein
MPRPKPGYHDVTVQIPEELWVALVEEGEREQRSATAQLTYILSLRYKIPVPRSKGPGRPPKKKLT